MARRRIPRGRCSRRGRLSRRYLPRRLRAPRRGRGLGCRCGRCSGRSPILLRQTCVRILPLPALLLICLRGPSLLGPNWALPLGVHIRAIDPCSRRISRTVPKVNIRSDDHIVACKKMCCFEQSCPSVRNVGDVNQARAYVPRISIPSALAPGRRLPALSGSQ
jgi:hypothetical protein